MSTYVPAFDSSRRRIHVLDTVRVRLHPTMNYVVGTVAKIVAEQVTVEYMVTGEVVMEDGAPTGRTRALENPRQESVTVSASEVSLWG